MPTCDPPADQAACPHRSDRSPAQSPRVGTLSYRLWSADLMTRQCVQRVRADLGRRTAPSVLRGDGLASAIERSATDPHRGEWVELEIARQRLRVRSKEHPRSAESIAQRVGNGFDCNDDPETVVEERVARRDVGRCNSNKTHVRTSVRMGLAVRRARPRQVRLSRFQGHPCRDGEGGPISGPLSVPRPSELRPSTSKRGVIKRKVIGARAGLRQPSGAPPSEAGAPSPRSPPPKSYS